MFNYKSKPDYKSNFKFNNCKFLYYQFLYASTVIEDASPIREPASPIATLIEKEQRPRLWQNLLSLALTPTLALHLFLNIIIKDSAYELTDIAELIKETDGNILIEPDKNTMKCKMESIKQHLALM